LPRFDPFPGLRYDGAHDLADVTAPPYDVIGPAERSDLLARDPANVVGIDLPVAAAASAGTGATEVGASTSTDPYDQAATTFERWQAEGVLQRDPPSFYPYRMDYLDETGAARHTIGVIGALQLSRPGEGGILPHEHTTKKAKSDRLDLQRATRANLSAVWGLSPAPGLSDLLDDDRPPLATWTDGEGVAHSLWMVHEEEPIGAIAAAVGHAPVVIADGHHRYETALAYRDEIRATNGDAAGSHDFVMCLIVELADDQLTVAPIHRLLSGLPADFDLAAALDPFFSTEPVDLAAIDPSIVDTMIERGALALVTNERSALLTPRPEAFAGVRDLDTVRLDHVLATFPDHSLVFQHGVTNVVTHVQSGGAQAGVLLRPATVAQIVAIADGGERMPPKTTFFSPKPRTGAVFRTLD
jgi:uncharacterized protein (DUF1015 family)